MARPEIYAEPVALRTTMAQNRIRRLTHDLKRRNTSVFYPIAEKGWTGAPHAGEAAKFLDAVPDDGFDTDLSILDAMVESLQILTPREAQTQATGLSIGVDQVRLDPGTLAAGISGERVAAVANDPNVPPGMNGAPEHLRYGFGDDTLDADVAPAQRQLLVYPVAGNALPHAGHKSVAFQPCMLRTFGARYIARQCGIHSKGRESLTRQTNR